MVWLGSHRSGAGALGWLPLSPQRSRSRSRVTLMSTHGSEVDAVRDVAHSPDAGDVGAAVAVHQHLTFGAWRTGQVGKGVERFRLRQAGFWTK